MLASIKWGTLVLLCALPLAFPWASQGQEPQANLADRDGNGLIEINSLTELHNMRYDLTGASHKTSTTSAGDSSGCPGAGCIGYELVQNLDFDEDDDGSTWSGSSDEGYRLDQDDSHADYFPVADGGWLPVGNAAEPFVAVFDGNGYSISNLAISRDQTELGLFGVTGGGAAIRNLRLLANLVHYSGSENGISIGGLVGFQSRGSITASYATGDVAGNDGGGDRVGGLVGYQDGGSITASYATGAVAGNDGNGDSVGGLVGWQNGGMITASYATGAVAGNDGNDDSVGGLVGFQGDGSITASYATGAVAGNDGNGDRVGGLVGQRNVGSITASYATGAVAGNDGNDDSVGGLVGFQFVSFITASYAIGSADGGDGDGDAVGGLVGRSFSSSIIDSYGFGTATGESAGEDGSQEAKGIDMAARLTAANAGSSWDDVGNNTLGAWDFADHTQIPALNYADYDGTTDTVFACDQFPANACGSLLTGQDDVIALGPSTVTIGGVVRLTGSLKVGRITIRSWIWRQLAGIEVELSDGGEASETTFTAPAPMTKESLLFELTAVDNGGREYRDRLSIDLATVDRDSDGLIDIDNLTELHNMRYNLAGTSYKSSRDAVGNSLGCPINRGGCHGYELMRDLDFDDDGDGSSWYVVDGVYMLDAEEEQDDYFPVESGAGGWSPIGDGKSPFVADFDGNSRTISNLAIRRDQIYLGFFGAIAGNAVIRNLGLIDNLADYTGSSSGSIYIGGLVGWQDGGTITASYATGAVAGGVGDSDVIGGLVGRQNGGMITASYATGAVGGGDGGFDLAGGLVGSQSRGGGITASYATGAVGGGDGRGDVVGGLVGRQFGGRITASYATGVAAGGDGYVDQAGGLVGSQSGGMITASYATGVADGGAGGSDQAGGLVGSQLGGMITASYATGVADGGGGGDDRAGALVSFRAVGSVITESYGFGKPLGREVRISDTDGSPKLRGVSVAAQLTAANAGSAWNDASSNTLNAWDFGDDAQIPALNYADYDGKTGTIFACNQFPDGACGDDTFTLLPGQDEASVSGPSSALEPGATVSLAGSPRYGRIGQFASFSWRQLAGPDAALSDAAAQAPTFTAPEVRDLLVFELTATAGDGREYRDRISLGVDVDRNDNGLIEIDSLLDLHYMRYNLKGTSYKTSSATSVGNSFGCPDRVCKGYELMQDLDFDGDDDDGGTWSGNGDEGYTLDSDDHQADYFPVDEDGAGGWLPIGNATNPFVAVFDGNSHTISNLAIRRDQAYVGLFGAIGGNAAISDLGLIDNLADYTGSSEGEIYIGGLAGEQSDGSITASYATGAADGGDGNFDYVGGLVGQQTGGSITASYATGAAAGGYGDVDKVGGLVGYQFGGSITASYATGAADDWDGGFGSVGGLVGQQTGGSITASYATGAAAGGDGDFDSVGGLVGYQEESSTITASYATGSADGGDGDFDYVGGLVGIQWRESSTITASYATGAADGGDGSDDSVGRLVGYQEEGLIMASYGFGGVMDGEVKGLDGSPQPDGVSTAAQLTADNAGPAWNDAGSNTLGAWDFGTETQIPALQYADYDGKTGTIFACNQFPDGACGDDTFTLLPGQADFIEVGSGGGDPGGGDSGGGNSGGGDSGGGNSGGGDSGGGNSGGGDSGGGGSGNGGSGNGGSGNGGSGNGGSGNGGSGNGSSGNGGSGNGSSGNGGSGSGSPGSGGSGSGSPGSGGSLGPRPLVALALPLLFGLSRRRRLIRAAAAVGQRLAVKKLLCFPSNSRSSLGGAEVAPRREWPPPAAS